MNSGMVQKIIKIAKKKIPAACNTKPSSSGFPTHINFMESQSK